MDFINFNSCQNVKYAFFKNNIINELLSNFSDLVVRKIIFGHEHRNLSDLLNNKYSEKREENG